MPRLNILSENEQIEFDYPPTLTTDARAIAFVIDDTLAAQIKKLRGATNKIGFLLQYAYFKASRRFFLIKRFRQEDIEYATKLLNIPIHKVKLYCYKNTTPNKHKEKILEMFDCKSYQAEKSWVAKEIVHKVQQVMELSHPLILNNRVCRHIGRNPPSLRIKIEYFQNKLCILGTILFG